MYPLKLSFTPMPPVMSDVEWVSLPVTPPEPWPRHHGQEVQSQQRTMRMQDGALRPIFVKLKAQCQTPGLSWSQDGPRLDCSLILKNPSLKVLRPGRIFWEPPQWYFIICFRGKVAETASASFWNSTHLGRFYNSITAIAGHLLTNQNLRILFC